jgi:hypothetical protein
VVLGGPGLDGEDELPPQAGRMSRASKARVFERLTTSENIMGFAGLA